MGIRDNIARNGIVREYSLPYLWLWIIHYWFSLSLKQNKENQIDMV